MRATVGVLLIGLLGAGCGAAKPNPFAQPVTGSTTPTKDLGPVGKPLVDYRVERLPAVGKPQVVSRHGPYGLARAPIVLVLNEHGQGPDGLLIYWRTTEPLPRERTFAFTSVDSVEGSPGELLEGTPPGYSSLARPDCYFTVAYERQGFRPAQTHRFELDVRRRSTADSPLISRVIARVRLRGVRPDEDGIGYEGTDDRRWRQLGCTPYS